MMAQALIQTLAARGVQLMPDGDGLVAKPASKLTDVDREAIRAQKAELVRLLLVDRIAAIWKPGESLAYRDGGQLITAKYAGTTASGRVNVWLADGAVRAVLAEAVALDWWPDAAEIFEERLSIILGAGVPEEVARVRAERCTREYLDRLTGGAA
ncbi:MAG: hypothetical protein ABSA52_16960 [Candidatus Binatia bacterium]|jgi:hypothetical protein